jgi:hypothetical protein
MAIKDYSTDPDLNVQISGINIAEGCPPSGINNAIRQLMADVKAEKDTRDAEQVAKDAEQVAKDAEQDAAITEAQSSANAANQGLVGVVRSVNGVAADAAGNVDDNIYGENYIRFTNGFQICFQTLGAGTWTYPQPFSKNPWIAVTSSTDTASATTVNTVTKANCKILCERSVSMMCIAVGWWK